MLSKIREKASGWIAWFIVILISIPFALWGINSYFEGLNTINVAEVNGVEIDAQNYQNTLSRERQRMARLMGANFDPTLLEGEDFKRRVLEGLVSDTLLREYVDDEGYRISDEQLRSEIAQNPAFQLDGVFSEDVYRAVLSSNGFSPEGYEAVQRQGGAIDQLRRAFVESALESDSELDRLLAVELQKRKADYALIQAARFQDAIEIDEEQIQQEYEQNKARYQAPARIKVAYLQLSVAELSQGLEPTEEELAEAYQQLKGRYREPESRQASHILFTVKADAEAEKKEEVRRRAEAVLEQARGGEDFAELAKVYSEDPGSKEKGGDLGVVAPGQMVQSFEEAVFSMEEGELRGPIETRFGFHLIKLTGLKPGRERAFEEVREEIAEVIRKQRAEEEFSELGENFRNLVFENPEDLQTAAEELGLAVQNSDWFTRDTGEGVAENPKVRSAAFGEEVVNEDLNSQVVEADPETLIAVRKLEYQDASTKQLEEVRGEIELRLKQEQARQEAVAIGTEVVAKLQAGEIAWQEIFADFQGESKTLPETRQEAKSGIERQVSAAVFGAAEPLEGQTSFGGAELANGDYAVYALRGVESGDPAQADDAQKQRMRQLLSSRSGQEFYQALVEGLRQSADVKIYDDQL